MTTEIYLDGNATTAVLPAALHAAVRAMELCYGNPSSSHATGLKAKALLDEVRARARRVLGSGDGRLMFNSGATEGIQTAVLSALCAIRERRAAGLPTGNLLVYGATEHKAVPESLAHWNRLLGLNLTLHRLPVDADGRHDLAALRAVAPDAAFVCTMAANNETGVISDLDGIAAALDGSPALWLVDCVQALGKLPLALAATRIDYAPFSGHKLYAPKGIGMLYVRAGTPFTPLMMGGGQEGAQRSGTENMAGIAALGAVLAALEEGGTFRTPVELAMLRDRVAASLREALPGIVFNTPFDKALPTTINFSVPGLSSKELLDVFDAAGIRVSAGSACSAAKAAPSYVLEAMGLSAWRSSSAVRLSFGPATDAATIAAACERLVRCGDALRRAGVVADGTTGTVALDGPLQLSVAGTHTWLLCDAASRVCVLIDPQAALAARVETLLGSHGYRLAARLSTRDGATWPVEGDVLMLGARPLRRLALGPDSVCYVLGHADGTPSHAFSGCADPASLASLLPPDTLLCPGRDEQSACCTSLRVALAGQDASATADMHLDGPALDALLRAHPDALLVDVREAYEHAAGGVAGLHAVSVPLSRFAAHLPAWLGRGDGAPLVFVCRSGNRSARAAECLRRHGYRRAYHLAGGVALAA
ncbi:aminotransferase class V-fold PLP-dependent enzyme [Pseudoduganella chitinolytica]|uniref:cysteine desulfurase n=1 Tax=Pseudoduganella chitinolytica TaxID=34070 RepID=A0ABY8BBD0_9BURK|nr:aminotransferase class V-fold PLP-dependent enzyme [Pseudoduganella chitinolytica]WEF32448.1 aminotransferase class V-fold PLP-dependent enzyme [Pseudoduganella chitinolytica]